VIRRASSNVKNWTSFSSPRAEVKGKMPWDTIRREAIMRVRCLFQRRIVMILFIP
jgi:hypothetical protein